MWCEPDGYSIDLQKSKSITAFDAAGRWTGVDGCSSPRCRGAAVRSAFRHVLYRWWRLLFRNSQCLLAITLQGGSAAAAGKRTPGFTPSRCAIMRTTVDTTPLIP